MQKFLLLLSFVIAPLLGATTASTQISIPSTNYYRPGSPILSGYAAAYDVRGAGALESQASWAKSTPTLDIGRGVSTDLVHELAYIYQSNIWRLQTLTSAPTLRSSNRYASFAHATLPSPSTTSSWTYAVGYFCAWAGIPWKCGCSDIACAAGKWQLQAYERPAQTTTPSNITTPTGKTTSNTTGNTTGGTATCQLGNHGLVRGWAHVANGTLVADDGCLLRGGADYQNPQPYGPGPQLDYWRKMHDDDHFNYVRLAVYVGGWYANADANPMTIDRVLAELDQAVAVASQLGLYLVIDNHTLPPGVTTSGNGMPPCADSINWNLNAQIWTAIAPRYASNTNVIYEIQNEPEAWNWNNGQFDCIWPQENSLFKLIRSYAPHTPVIAWSFGDLGSPDVAGYGLLNLMTKGSDIDYSNAVVGGHPYINPWEPRYGQRFTSPLPGVTNQIDEYTVLVKGLRSAGYPVMDTEYTPCTDTYWSKLLPMQESLGVSWNCGDDPMNTSINITWPAD